MAPIRKFAAGLVALFRKQKADQELEDELREFTEASVEQKMRAGLNREEALRAARVEVGSTAAIRDQVQQSGWESVIEGIWQDVHYGARTLKNAPGFTAVAVLTLALGIGVNAGIFTILNAAALRPLPLARSGELVSIYQDLRGQIHRNVNGSPSMSSYPEYRDFRDSNHVFSGLVAYAPFIPATLNSDTPAEVIGTLASCNYFDVLGVHTALGRVFIESECAASGVGTVVVLSNDLWRSEFGSDPAIVGKVIHLNRVTLTVIGVAPAGFTGTEAVSSSFWTPLSMQSSLTHREDFTADPFTGWLVVTGRLRPGIALEQARADLSVIAARFDQLQPGRTTKVIVEKSTLSSDPEMRIVVLGVGSVILCAVGLVLLIACANLANLLLARGAGRGREIAVRLAMGARRTRIIRQLLTENLLLALIGGCLGTFAAFWVPAAGVHFLLTHLPPGSWTFVLDVHPDLRVLGYALGLTLITGFAFGLIPALRSSRADLTVAMKEGSQSFEGEHHKSGFLRNFLVGIQVAVCMVLLSAAALLLKGLYRAQTADPGFALKNIFATSFNLQAAGYDQQRAADFQNKLHDQLIAFPGVDAVAQAAVTPLGNQHDQTGFSVPETGRNFPVEFNAVSPEYFSALAIPIVRGRSFTDAECRGNSPVAIVTESTAQRFWPGQDAIGKVLRRGTGASVQVIGVAKDAQVSNLGKSDNSYIYLPDAPGSQLRFTFIVHSRIGSGFTKDGIRDAVARLDPQLPVRVAPLEDNLEFWRSAARIVSALSGILAGFALLLASIGIYGMASYSVSRRVREIGIRMALGANSGNILFLVLRQAMRSVILGAVVGLGGCAAVSGIFSSLLYGVSPHDPLAFVSVAAFFLAIALLATYIPARRAIQVDPTEALRHE